MFVWLLVLYDSLNWRAVNVTNILITMPGDRSENVETIYQMFFIALTFLSLV